MSFMKKIGVFIYISLLFSLITACDSSSSKLTMFDALPLNTAAFLEVDDLGGFVKSAREKSYVNELRTMTHAEDFALFVTALDTIFSDESKWSVMSSPAVFATINEENASSKLLLINPYKTLKNKDIVNLLNAKNIACNESESCYGFALNEADSVYIAANKGFVCLSTNAHTCSLPFEQLNQQTKITDIQGFDAISSTLGTSVGAHLYVRSDVLLNANKHKFSDEAKKRSLPLLDDDLMTAACDFLLKDDGLILNGYATAVDTSDLFKLKYQQAVRNSILYVLPYDVQMMLHYGMSDMALWWGDKIDTVQIASLDKKYGVDIEKQLVENISELALAVLSTNNAPIVVARLNDPATVMKFMGRLDASIGVSSEHITQGCPVKTLNVSDLTRKMLGDEFAKVNRFCYTILDQYLVIANKMSDVDEVISFYRSGRTLDLNENFRAFQNNMLEEANITFYMPCASNLPLIKTYLSQDASKLVDKKAVETFQAFSLQMSSARNLIYTSIFLRKMQASNQESRVIWKSTLDAPLLMKPFILSDHANGERYVFAFDNLNNAYLIDAKGEIKWKKPLSESPISNVETVDCYNNGKTQYLFNSANYLHLIDRNGDYVEGYPVRLPVEASNGLAVFDYQGVKDYRILLCGTDKLVYNFTIKGTETEGWNRHRTDNIVNKPVEHLVADGKDYLIVTDTEGTVRILDRQGRVRVPLVGDLQKSPTADIYINKTNNKGIMLTSSKDGKLLYITSDGRTAQTDFGEFSDKHFFLYEDFNQDSSPDFIYLDGNELHIFDKFKNDLFTYSFKNEIKQKPVFFNITRSRRLLGIVSEASREIYLIDKNGKMISSSGLVGETPFAVGSLLNNNEINLVTGVGNTLFNYSLK